MKIIFVAEATVLLLLAAMQGTAMTTESGTMRCAGGVVSVGDTAGEVKGKCGEPAFATQRQEWRIGKSARGRREGTVDYVTVDDWTFNFGPNQFQYRLLLEYGSVARIESLDYGY